MSEPESSTSAAEPGQSKRRACSACLREFDRKEIHRNRYGEYICKACQQKGLRFASRGKIVRTRRQVKTWLTRLAWILLVGLALASYYELTRDAAETPGAEAGG